MGRSFDKWLVCSVNVVPTDFIASYIKEPLPRHIVPEMPGCAVPPCGYHTNRAGRGQNVILHRLPDDTTLADVWWQIIRRLASKDSVRDKRVCSLHFKEEDYERDMKWELLNPGRSLMLMCECST